MCIILKTLKPSSFPGALKNAPYLLTNGDNPYIMTLDSLDSMCLNGDGHCRGEDDTPH